MNPTPRTMPDLHANWLQPGWSTLAALVPGQPVREPTPNPSPAPAEPEWEDEGGSVKLPTHPQVEQAPQRPL